MNSKQSPPRKSRTFYQAKRAEFRRRFPDRNCSSIEFARRLGVSVHTVARWRKEYFPGKIKFPKRKPHPKRLVFRRLYRSRAFTLSQIAQRIGVKRRTLVSWVGQDFPEGAAWRWLEFVRLYELDLYTPAELAIALECHPNSIFRLRKRYGDTWPELAKLRKGNSKHTGPVRTSGKPCAQSAENLGQEVATGANGPRGFVKWGKRAGW